MSHSPIAMVLRNKTKVLKAVRGSTSLKALRPTKIQEGHVSDMKKHVMTQIAN
jgi:hypothetical protein